MELQSPILSTKYHSNNLSPPFTNNMVAQATTSRSQEGHLYRHRNQHLASVRALHMPTIMDQAHPTGHIQLNIISLRLHRLWVHISIHIANIRFTSRNSLTMKVIRLLRVNITRHLLTISSLT